MSEISFDTLIRFASQFARETDSVQEQLIGILRGERDVTDARLVNRNALKYMRNLIRDARKLRIISEDEFDDMIDWFIHPDEQIDRGLRHER
jgi:hypothetical protein